MSFLFPEKYKIVCGSPIATTNAGFTADYISVKNCSRVIIIAELLQAVGHQTVLSVSEATAVLPLGAQAMTALQPNWANTNVATSDALTHNADAATVTASIAATTQLLILEILPERLSSGFDCLAAVLSNSGQATNFASVVYLLESKYAQATPPSAIAD